MEIDDLAIDDLPIKQQQICKILRPLIYAFPNSKITKQTIITYSIALSDLSVKELNASVFKCMNVCLDFFPSIAKIREEAKSVMNTAVGSEIKTIEEAWQEVQEKMRSWSVGRPLEWSTPEIAEAVKLVGFRNMCCSEKISVQQAHFIKHYENLVNRKNSDSINIEILLNINGDIKKLFEDNIKKIGS